MTSEFREQARLVAERAADYLERVEERRIVPDIRPGDVRRAIPERAPDSPQPFGEILDDYTSLIEPNVTHWQHPGFMAYFSSTAPEPAILGEWLAAALNSNVMFWKNAPASTELEERMVGWLRGMLGLPDAFDGMFTDTASISTLLSIAAARHVVPGLDARERGLAGRTDVGPLRLYLSEEAHSSVDKGAILAGIGREHVVRVPTDDGLRMDPAALAAAIDDDRRAGRTPFCVVATLGTTSSSAIDPVAAIADVCERERLWLHVDAAWGGAAAVAPELRPLFTGWERADSIVVNPHKWLFTPFDASLLLFRRPGVYRDAFSLVADYLKDSAIDGAHNFNEYGVQLGRRFRALKVWFLLRAWGVEGVVRRVREHCELARELVGLVEQEPCWETMAPVPLALVCLRHRPPGLDDGESLDAHNRQILERVNDGGRFYLSGTVLRGRFVIRVAFGNPRQTREHLRGVWAALREAAGGDRRPLS